MAEDENRLDKLLNSNLPYAPISEEDKKARLERVGNSAKFTPAEPGAGESVAKSGRSGAVSMSGSRAAEPKPERSESARPQSELRADSFQNFDRLLDEIGQLSTMMALPSSSTGSATGVDRTGTIEVELSDGGTLYSLALRRRWQNHLTEDLFDSAVLEAISNAVAETLDLCLDAGGEQTSDLDAGRPLNNFGSSGWWRPPVGVDPDFVLRQVNALLDDAGRKLDEFERALAQPSPGASIKSVNRYVTLEVKDRTVTGVSTHKPWLKRADPSRICEEFSSAFAALQETVALSEENARQRRANEEGDVQRTIEELRNLIRDTGFPGV